MKQRKLRKDRIAMLLAPIVLVSGGFSYHFLQDDEVEPTALPETTPEVVVTDSPIETVTPTIEPTVVPVSENAYAPIQVDNTTDFKSTWITSGEGFTTDFTYLTKTIVITDGGSDPSAITFGQYGFYADANTPVTISFEANATSNQSVPLRILDANTGDVLQEYSVSLTNQQQSYSYTYTSEISRHYLMAQFLVGGVNNQTITVTDFRWAQASFENASNDIKVNQVGYRLEDQKRCTFSKDEGDYFDVIDSNQQIVYTGAILNQMDDSDTGETTYYGDFTNVLNEGTYYIVSELGNRSYPFTITYDPYVDLSKSLIHMISLQRCTFELDPSWAGPFAHTWCHDTWATNYASLETKDVSGGWHDAADYGRYVTTGGKAVSDLLFAYLLNPTYFTDDTNSAESGNGIPDVLDEVRYELEWMFKMQNNDGSVNSKVLTPGVSGEPDPSNDHQELYILYPDTQAAGMLCAVMALSSKIYEPFDSEFAHRCLKAAEAANGYLSANYENQITSQNPPEFNGGLYRDDNDKDERMYAAAAMYYATGEKSWLGNLEYRFVEEETGLAGASWRDVAMFAKFLLAFSNLENDSPTMYAQVMESITSEADAVLETINASNYGISITNYEWGSNGFAVDNGEVLAMAYLITGDMKYRQGAVDQVSYVLGRNSLNMCFVTTYGSNSPQHVHQYASNAYGIVYPGALVGGPNKSREDTVSINLPYDTPNAKMYVDAFQSYSTNEVSIYWNSALINLVALLDAESSIS